MLAKPQTCITPDCGKVFPGHQTVDSQVTMDSSSVCDHHSYVGNKEDFNTFERLPPGICNIRSFLLTDFDTFY